MSRAGQRSGSPVSSHSGIAPFLPRERSLVVDCVYRAQRAVTNSFACPRSLAGCSPLILRYSAISNRFRIKHKRRRWVTRGTARKLRLMDGDAHLCTDNPKAFAFCDDYSLLRFTRMTTHRAPPWIASRLAWVNIWESPVRRSASRRAWRSAQAVRQHSVAD